MSTTTEPPSALILIRTTIGLPPGLSCAFSAGAPSKRREPRGARSQFKQPVAARKSTRDSRSRTSAASCLVKKRPASAPSNAQTWNTLYPATLVAVAVAPETGAALPPRSHDPLDDWRCAPVRLQFAPTRRQPDRFLSISSARQSVSG